MQKNTYEIFEHEINRTTKIRAQGFLEALTDLLPWNDVQLEIDYKPKLRQCKITDKSTQFEYTITLLG